MNGFKDLTCHLVKMIDPQGRINYLHNPFSKQNTLGTQVGLNSLGLMTSWEITQQWGFQVVSHRK